MELDDNKLIESVLKLSHTIKPKVLAEQIGVTYNHFMISLRADKLSDGMKLKFNQLIEKKWNL